MTGIHNPSSELFIGLMSGTSLDAIDAVLVDFQQHPLKIIATYSHILPQSLKKSILHLCQAPQASIEKLGQLDATLGILFGETCLKLIRQAGVNPKTISAIGSHGQTIRHRPDLNPPFTLQIGDPNTISNITGITTIADFRRKDMAASGQGAPLAPGFHQYYLGHSSEPRFVVNIGGIANITYLSPNPMTVGFDTGPGNTLLDAWYQKHFQKPYDAQGHWAASGSAQPQLLHTLLADAYFHKPPPKSTGREYFNLNWLQSYLEKAAELAPQDVQATLLELTAQSIIKAIDHFNQKHGEIWICGGGAANHRLMTRLQELSQPYYSLQTTEALGIHPQWVEACAFAWLARQTLQGLPGNIKSVTGANRDCILGGIYLPN
jgi:anhydro-N-acetylmuramic acid kinase